MRLLLMETENIRQSVRACVCVCEWGVPIEAASWLDFVRLVEDGRLLVVAAKLSLSKGMLQQHRAG